MTAASLSGCSRAEAVSDGKINVVCMIFPQYDWVRQIIGDDAENFDVTLLLDKRIDLHNYQPTVDDFIKISVCDLLIYVGGESDKWVNDALKKAANKNMAVINLLETIGYSVKYVEIVEGMEDDGHDHGYEHGDGEAHGDGDNHGTGGANTSAHDHGTGGANTTAHNHRTDYDEHVWLSLRHAQTFCSAIAGAVTALDPGNAEKYSNNLTAYIDKLAGLDSQYEAAVKAAPVRTLIFGDRFPFRYLADDYGLIYHAAFVGCSAETEANFDTIIYLAKKMDELNMKYIVVTESSDKKIAETVIRESGGGNQKILVLDAIQSAASGDIANGTTYLSVMEDNLRILKEALA